MKNKRILLILNILILNIYSAQEAVFKDIEIPKHYKYFDNIIEKIDINSKDPISGKSYLELIKKENYTYYLARVVTEDTNNPQKYNVNYYDADYLNQYIFPDGEIFSIDAELREHLLSKTDVKNCLPIRDIQYFEVNGINESSFKYYKNVHDLRIKNPELEKQAEDFFKLAQSYFSVRNDQLAFQYFKRVVNNPQAQRKTKAWADLQIGILYFVSEIEKSYTLSLSYFISVVKNSQSELITKAWAELYLGKIYHYGYGVKVNYKIARQYFEGVIGNQEASPEAQKIAKLYLKGDCVIL